MCRLPVREEQTASIDEALKAAEWLTEEELQQEQQKIFASWASRASKRVPGMTYMVSYFPNHSWHVQLLFSSLYK